MKPHNIFDKTPRHWGLRGDPHLWEELKEETCNYPGFETADEFRLFLKTTIERIIDQPLIKGQYPYVERFNSGGMSGGRIDCAFWLKTALPLLVSRFNEARQG